MNKKQKKKLEGLDNNKDEGLIKMNIENFLIIQLTFYKNNILFYIML